jgi:N utilization substance protein B
MTNTATVDPRHAARALALQQLFTRFVQGKAEIEATSLLEALEISEYEEDLAASIMEGVIANEDNIDPVISKLAPAWPIAQIAPVDLIVLRMAIWEGFVAKRTPATIVINEAIDLAKEFGGENSGSFVNGVLGSLLENKELQSELVQTTTV